MNIRRMLSVLMLFFCCFGAELGAQQIKSGDAELRGQILSRLVNQLGDARIANELTDFLMDDVLTWKAEPLEIARADSILAFAFGNRIAQNGNQTPGKMNEYLADLVVELYETTRKPVYAQWEIAQLLGNRVPENSLTAIYPVVGSDGEVVYLSTEGVVLDIVKQAGGSERLGNALIVAFSDHSLRAVNLARSAGIAAYVPKGIELPIAYDSRSGQPWTRDRLTFLLSEIRTRSSVRSSLLPK